MRVVPKRKVLDAARALKKQRDALERENRILEERLEHINDLERWAETPNARIERREPNSSLREGTAVALLSDVHCGEIVDPAQVDGMNEYNLEVCKARLSKFFRGLIYLVKNDQKAFHINDLILWLGGDIITGYLRDEDLEMCELSPLESTVIIKALLIDGIKYLLEELDVEELHILCNHGNHGRSVKKPTIKSSAKNSYEHLLYLLLAEEFRGEPRVKFVVCPGKILYFPIYNYLTRWMHGDGIKYNKGIGGVGVPLNRDIFRRNKARPCLVTNLGHFHNRQLGSGYVINGALVGHNEYAEYQGFEYTPPEQSFYIIDSRRGVCRETPIWVD